MIDKYNRKIDKYMDRRIEGWKDRSIGMGVTKYVVFVR